ncbi:hypothetical protein [Lacinutrix salivirga]
MSEKLITIKEVSLNNNCPECFNTNGLELTFKQKFVETLWMKRVTQDTIYELHCNTCNTAIYPVRWTDDIERVFEYQQRAFTPKKSSTKLKKASWILIVTIVILIVTLTTLVIVK